MDYLHGDVVGDEFKAACQYEYARESYVLRRATQLSRSKLTADIGHVAAQIESEFHCGSWFFQSEWGFLAVSIVSRKGLEST